MPIRYHWTNEAQKILHIQFCDDWTWDDYFPIRDEVQRSISDQRHPIHFIADFSGNSTLPPRSLLVVRHVFENYLTHENKIMVVGTSIYLRFIMQNIYTIMPHLKKRLILFPTLESAHNHLANEY